MKKYTTTAILIFVFASVVHAQTLSVSRIDIQKEKLLVYFTIDDANPNHTYQVSLYSSKDNFAAPLTKVAGDVGTEVKPGPEKKIEWNMASELGAYKGELAIEVRAGVFIPFVRLTGFDTSKKYKRGRAYPLLWTSGNMGGQIDIDLYSGQNRVDGDRNVPNTGKYEFAIAGSVKPGSDYRLKFTNTRNRDEYIYSNTFRIVPKIPFVIKGIGLLALVSGAYLLFGGEDPPTKPSETEIENWPDEPKGN